MKYCIRCAAGEDLKAIADIEAVSFPDPWSLQALTDSFENEYCHMFCAEDTDTHAVIGSVCLYELGGEGEIAGIAVHPSCRRQGIARALLSAVFAFAGERQLSCVHLDVRASNTPAIALYESSGFRRDGIRKNYYRTPREDAVLMTYADSKEI